MQEIELKFLVPDYKIDALMRQANIKSSQTTQLAAHYFDTADHQLAAAGMALRIRQEDEAWVQTIKAAGDGMMARVEHNHTLSVDGQGSGFEDAADGKTQQKKKKKNAAKGAAKSAQPDAPSSELGSELDSGLGANFSPNHLNPDLNVYADTPVSEHLSSFDMETLKQTLIRQYITDVTRISRLVKKDGTTIEVAFDQGLVKHGEDQSQTHALCEVEFELVEGDVTTLFEVAKTWCKRYKLCLSTVTKAERGGLLLAEKTHADATKADVKQLAVHKKMSQAEFMRAVVHNCLLQILPNASAIAAASQDGNHVHQLRVGIRRLRTALKYFSGFSSQINEEWILVLKQTFSLLGEYRDIEILQTKTQPMLEQEGSPHVAWPMDIKVMPIDAVRANDFQLTLLELIEYATSNPKHDETHNKKAKTKVKKRLNKLFKQVASGSDEFAKLDIEAQHDVRKRLKSLRYVCEFVAPMYKKKSTKAFIKYLQPAQDILGDYNDNMVGHERYLQKAKIDNNAYFAVGWFNARERVAAKECAEYLHVVKNAPVFW